jgi:hypothetical protein
MRRLGFAIMGMAMVAGLVGCRNLQPPNWFQAGPVEYQQSQAQQFDPYPEIEPGPEIVGARPLEYDKPPAEVLRVQKTRNPLEAQWLPWNW